MARSPFSALTLLVGRQPTGRASGL